MPINIDPLNLISFNIKNCDYLTYLYKNFYIQLSDDYISLKIIYFYLFIYLILAETKPIGS